MAELKDLIKSGLGCQSVHDLGASGGGCISNSRAFKTENGKLFVKIYEQVKGDVMFKGEFASLKAIKETQTVRVPNPIKIINDEERQQCIFIMEHIDMRGLSKYQTKLGEELARLHLHNKKLLDIEQKEEGTITGKQRHAKAVTEFGFDETTSCGSIPQDNSWNKCWIEFYSRQKLQQQITLLQDEYQDRKLEECWSELQLNLPKLFKNMEIKPSLLHGDLWSGNAAETPTGPVIYDPASFYGHDEYDLGIAGMFGGFNKHFYDAYHSLIPKATGFELRHSLYMLFHYLNHWNLFGTSYRSQALSMFKKINKTVQEFPIFE